jgi:glycosyltransferase involved in cell wall biosynthesis
MFLKFYERFLCKISNVVLVDTKTHKNYFEKEFSTKNVDYLYVGCNDRLFKSITTKRDNSKFIVFWYGYANPLQGVDVILKSAKLLEHKKIIFRLIGPIKKKYSKLIQELKLRNVEFIDFIPYEKLPMEINKSDICLGGHFSNKNKAKRVIAGKTFQFISCNKLTILGDNLANRELFNEKGIIHFVKMNSPNTLANKILEIKK